MNGSSSSSSSPSLEFTLASSRSLTNNCSSYVVMDNLFNNRNYHIVDFSYRYTVQIFSCMINLYKMLLVVFFLGYQMNQIQKSELAKSANVFITFFKEGVRK